jgi:hypothetical protein
MPKTTPAEWLLARIIGPDRAAAIMGDLTELAATRGRLWFWTAYVRALISLGWRTPVAFLFAIASVRLMFSAVFPWLANHITRNMMDAGLFGENNPHFRMAIWNLVILTTQCLCFALPFVLVRLGLRSRLTQLAGALFLVSAPAYIYRPWLLDLAGLSLAIAIVAALLLPLWRKPMAVLAATCATFIAAVATCFYILATVYHDNPLSLPMSKVGICDGVGIALALIVCSLLHRRLQRQRPAIA